MKLAFLVNKLTPVGGIGRVVLNLSNILKAKGHDIKILTISYDSNFIKKYRINKSDIITSDRLKFLDLANNFPILGYLLQILKFILFGISLSKKISKLNLRLINSHYYLCGLSGWILSKITKLPHILTIHGIHSTKSNMKVVHYWLDYWILKFIKNRVKDLISVDPTLKLNHRFREASDHIEVIFPCLDKYFLHDSQKIKSSTDLIGKPKLMFVGRLEKHKNLKELFMNLASVQAYWSELRIIGSGSYEHSLERLAKELNIHNKVSFLGFLDGLEKLDAMNGADIFISYSKSEGFPLVILESLALGKLCIFFPTGGIIYFRKKFEAEQLGIFLESNKKFLEKILEHSYISNFFHSKQIDARRNFAQKFTPEIIGEQYLNYFLKILSLKYKKSQFQLQDRFHLQYLLID